MEQLTKPCIALLFAVRKEDSYWHLRLEAKNAWRITKYSNGIPAHSHEHNAQLKLS